MAVLLRQWGSEAWVQWLPLELLGDTLLDMLDDFPCSIFLSLVPVMGPPMRAIVLLLIRALALR